MCPIQIVEEGFSPSYQGFHRFPTYFPPPFRRVCLADILTSNEMNMQPTTQN
jgi:hypothetical protein